MSAFPYQLSDVEAATLGLVVLRVDETIEQEFRRYVPPELARLYVTRVQSGDDLTPDSIAHMAADLTNAAALLPPAAHFDVIGYACTSGAALLGAEHVQAQVSAGAATRAVTNPLTAAITMINERGLQRIGIVSPYVDSVAVPLRAAFVAQGIVVVDTLSFGEEVEARVARIDPASIKDAAEALVRRSQLDGVFLSCTNLRTFDCLADLERDLRVPVFSSNQALAWHMRRLAGLPEDLSLDR